MNRLGKVQVIVDKFLKDLLKNISVSAEKLDYILEGRMLFKL